MNPSEGRVPVSWNECADWLDWFGPEFVVRKFGGEWSPTLWTAGRFRNTQVTTGNPLGRYRLLPPSGLVAAPEGMDGGGWLGQGKDVPDGWEWRCNVAGITPNWVAPWVRPHPADVVQCRPPAPKREPEWVPLTKLVGRTVWGETKPVKDWAIYPDSGRWTAESCRGSRFFPDGTLDLDTGRVKVEPEGEQ